MNIFKLFAKVVVDAVMDKITKFQDSRKQQRKHRASMDNEVYAKAYTNAYQGAIKEKGLTTQFILTGFLCVLAVICIIAFILKVCVHHENGGNIFVIAIIGILIVWVYLNQKYFRSVRIEAMNTAQAAVRTDDNEKHKEKRKEEKAKEAEALEKKRQEDAKRAAEVKAANQARKNAVKKAAAKKPAAPSTGSTGSKQLKGFNRPKL